MWIVILIGFLFSTGIEVTQLLTYRGLFELDDIFYNTLGTAIGVAALYAVRSYTSSIQGLWHILQSTLAWTFS